MNYASHEVRAPGGYERWRFFAFDRDLNRMFLATFSDGDPSYGAYRRRMKSFIQRPTKLLPPLPRDFATFQWTLLRDQKFEIGLSPQPVPRDLFAASSERLDLTAGIATCRETVGRIELSIPGIASLAFEVAILTGEPAGVSGTIMLPDSPTEFHGVGALHHEFGTHQPTLDAYRDADERAVEEMGVKLRSATLIKVTQG